MSHDFQEVIDELHRGRELLTSTSGTQGTLSQLSVKTDIPMPEFSSGAYSLGIGNDGAIAVSIGNRNRSESGRTTGNSSPGDCRRCRYRQGF